MADTQITQLVPSLLVQSEAYYDKYLSTNFLATSKGWFFSGFFVSGVALFMFSCNMIHCNSYLYTVLDPLLGLGNHCTYQGVKLRLIQAPMRLNFSLWRPNPEN